MRRPRIQVTYSFEGGQADPIYERRSDSDVWIKTAKVLRNVRLDNGGGAHRRPGLAYGASTANATRMREFVCRDGARRLMAFRSGAVDIYKTDRTIEQTLGGAPWVTGDLQSMQISPESDRLFITSNSFAPQQITRSSAGVWSLATLSYDANPDGSSTQPYFRFSDTKGIALQPSGTSGGIGLTASAALFAAGHVGARFRLLGREVVITGFTNSTSVSATVIAGLFPTKQWTVASTVGFAVGDELKTSSDAILAIVTQVMSSTVLEVLYTDGFTDPTTTSNTVVGPNAASALSAVGGAGGQGATVQWDEQMISAVRGYPNASVVHRDRLFLADFPKAPETIAASVQGVLSSFDLGSAEDTDAFIEGIGDAIGRRIRHLVSAEQLIALTELGSYYAGEGPGQPLTPTTVDFQRIGPEPASACNPVVLAEGIVFMDSVGDRVMRLEPTGNVRRVWGATEMADLAPDLFNAPVRLLLVDGGAWGAERYILAVNAAGDIGVMLYRRGADVIGSTPWDTPGGLFFDVATFGSEVWACVNRGGAYTLEVFDIDRMLDRSTLVSNVSPATPTDVKWAGLSTALVWRKTASGEARRVDVGQWTASGAGALTGAPTYTRDYEGGLRFTFEIDLWPPIDPMEGPASWQRISRAAIDVRKSGRFYALNRVYDPYRGSDDVTEPPPLRTGWRNGRFLGRKRDNVFTITQVEAAPLHVRAISMDVT